MKSERVVNTFTDLVQIYSPSGSIVLDGEKEMALEVAKRLKRLGIEPFIDPIWNVVAHLSGNNEKEPLILNAHLDTVEPGKNIKPQISNGRIISDGTTILGADNKAAVAAILEAIERLVEEGSTTHHPLDLIFTTREESSTDGPLKLDYSRVKAKRGFSFDYAASLGRIITAAPFYNRFSLNIEGRSGHASIPESSDNALAIFSDAHHRLRWGRLDEDSVRNIRLIDPELQILKTNPNIFSVSRNTIGGTLIGEGEVRSFLESKVERYTNQVRRVFENAIKRANSEKIKFSFDPIRENGGYKFEDNDPFVLATKTALESLGYNPILEHSLGCADANNFAAMGIQILVLSSGNEDAHSLKESISINNLIGLADLAYSLVKE